jgi:hypothetical protein
VALNERSTSKGLLRYVLILYVKVDPVVPFKLGIFLLKIELPAQSKIVAFAMSPQMSTAVTVRFRELTSGGRSPDISRVLLSNCSQDGPSTEMRTIAEEFAFCPFI